MKASSLYSIVHVLLLFTIFLAVGVEAYGAAQMCATLPAPPDQLIGGRILPIVEVRGDVPYVEFGGKEVAVSSDSIQLYKSEIIRSDAKVAPNWVFASNQKFQQTGFRYVSTPGGPFNKELLFSVDLESPVALDKVWIALSITSESGGSGSILQEIGYLSPYSSKTVTIHKQLTVELGKGSFVWHVFTHGREVLHTLMRNGTFEAEVKLKAAEARNRVKNAEAEPYLTFPPRDPFDAKGPVILAVEIASSGEIKHASVVGSNDQKAEQSLLDSVSHWWFLPKIVDGKKVSERMTVTVDLSQRDKWSNDFVRPVANPSK